VERTLATALGQDLTQLAAAEKQLLLSRLLPQMAHEIRNPLSSLDIHVQLLEEDLAQVAPQAHDRFAGRLEIIHGELHRPENLVRQFLRLAGPSALILAPVEIGKVIGHVHGLLQPEAAARGIEIVARTENNLPTLSADAGQLTQVFLNLIINAVQAIGRNGRIEVLARQSEGAMSIDVRDSGSGLPSGKLNAIFDPYFTTKPDGSGLGLWIAQQIVAAHGGVIQAANAPAGGAIFTVRLPLPEETIQGERGCPQPQQPQIGQAAETNHGKRCG